MAGSGSSWLRFKESVGLSVWSLSSGGQTDRLCFSVTTGELLIQPGGVLGDDFGKSTWVSTSSNAGVEFFERRCRLSTSKKVSWISRRCVLASRGSALRVRRQRTTRSAPWMARAARCSRRPWPGTVSGRSSRPSSRSRSQAVTSWGRCPGDIPATAIAYRGDRTGAASARIGECRIEPRPKARSIKNRFPARIYVSIRTDFLRKGRHEAPKIRTSSLTHRGEFW